MHDPSPTPRDGVESLPPVPAGGIVRRWGIRYRELVALGEPPGRNRMDVLREAKSRIAAPPGHWRIG